jgi:hypothetical protein
LRGDQRGGGAGGRGFRLASSSLYEHCKLGWTAISKGRRTMPWAPAAAEPTGLDWEHTQTGLGSNCWPSGQAADRAHGELVVAHLRH